MGFTKEEINHLYCKKLESIYELEADIWMSTQHQNIAEVKRTTMVRYIQASKGRPDIYQSPSDNLYTLTKIIQLHNKEKKE